MRNFFFFFSSLFFSLFFGLLFIGKLPAQSFSTPKQELLTDELGFQISMGSSGEIFIAGKIPAFTSDECYISMHDSAGNFIWAKMIGGINYDYFKKALSIDNDIICGGNTNSFGQSQNFYLVKFDPSGDTVWTRILSGSKYDRLTDAIINGDGFLLGGYSNSFGSPSNNDILLMNTDSSGTPVWAKSIEAAGEDILHAVKKAEDGGFIIIGSTNSFGTGSKDGFVLKTDSAGNPEWLKCFGGTDEEDALDLAIKDGNIYVTGYTKSITGMQDLWIFKSDTGGNLLWNKSIDFGLNEKGNKIFIRNGNLFICGYMQSLSGSGDDIFVIKMDESGNNIQTKHLQLPGPQYGNYIGESVGKFFAAGLSTDSIKMKIFEINDSLLSCASVIIDADSINPVFASTTASFIVNPIPLDSINVQSGGDFANYGNPYVSAEICLLPEDTLTTVEKSEPAFTDNMTSRFCIFPNPNNGKFTLKTGIDNTVTDMAIMNVAGEIIFQFHGLLPGTYYSFDLPIGIYFLRISDKDLYHFEKIVIQDF